MEQTKDCSLKHKEDASRTSGAARLIVFEALRAYSSSRRFAPTTFRSASRLLVVFQSASRTSGASRLLLFEALRTSLLSAPAPPPRKTLRAYSFSKRFAHVRRFASRLYLEARFAQSGASRLLLFFFDALRALRLYLEARASRNQGASRLLVFEALRASLLGNALL